MLNADYQLNLYFIYSRHLKKSFVESSLFVFLKTLFYMRGVDLHWRVVVGVHIMWHFML